MVDPRKATVGTVQLRLLAVTDQQGTITVNGPAVPVAIRQPGALARLTFNGVAGQRIAVQLTAVTVPEHCSPVQLRDPASYVIAGGCLFAGCGEIKAVTLPVTGSYSIVLDPDAYATGTAQILPRAG